MSIQQINLSRIIRGKSRIRIRIITVDGNSTKGILEILIPSYSEDTVDSLTFPISTENLKDKHNKLNKSTNTITTKWNDSKI